MDEDKTAEVLQQLTPGLVLSSEKVRLSFESFLRRGTTAEREQLFLLNVKPTFQVSQKKHDATDGGFRNTPKNGDQRRKTKQGPLNSTFSKVSNPSKSEASQPPLSLAASSSHSSQSHDAEKLDLAEAYTYLCDANTKDPHPGKFISAAMSYVSSVANPVDGLENLKIKCDVFGKGQSKFGHLYYGHQQAQNAGAMFSCLSRLILVLMRHELDRRISVIGKDRTARGRGKMTVALEDLSKELSVEKNNLKDYNARATLYCMLIEKCGPGDLASLGSSNNHTWEKILSLNDVDFLVSFRRHRFPEVEKAARKLDFPIARLMIKALIACGWKYNELAGSKTRLIAQLGRFINIGRLALGEIIEAAKDTLDAPQIQQSPTRRKKRNSTSQQPCAKKQRGSVLQWNVKLEQGNRYARSVIYLGTLADAHNMASEKTNGSSSLLGCLSTEDITESTFMPGIEMTQRSSLPVLPQLDSRSVGDCLDDVHQDCTGSSAIASSRCDGSSDSRSHTQMQNSVTDCVPAVPPSDANTRSIIALSDDDHDEDNHGNSKQLVYPRFGKKPAWVEEEDLKRLSDNGLLNDNLIGFYIRFLEDHLDRTNRELADRICFFSTYFYTTLTDCHEKPINYARVEELTRKVDIFSYDYIVIPINEESHWYTAIICKLPSAEGVSMTGLKQLPEDSQERPFQAESDTKMVPEMPASHKYITQKKKRIGHKKNFEFDEITQQLMIITFDSLGQNRSRTVGKLKTTLSA